MRRRSRFHGRLAGSDPWAGSGRVRRSERRSWSHLAPRPSARARVRALAGGRRGVPAGGRLFVLADGEARDVSGRRRRVTLRRPTVPSLDELGAGPYPERDGGRLGAGGLAAAVVRGSAGARPGLGRASWSTVERAADEVRWTTAGRARAGSGWSDGRPVARVLAGYRRERVAGPVPRRAGRHRPPAARSRWT